jgi:hypothetical protein
VLALPGCATRLWWGDKSTTLSLGMSTQRVQAVLGPPQHMLTQQWQDVIVESWKYVNRSVTFHHGLVQSWSVPEAP